MKQPLGNVLFYFLVLLLSFLQAGDFTYKFNVDNPSPYVKEAVLLTLDVNQTNHDIVLLFDFDLKKSEAYHFQRINIKEVDAYHAAQIRYTYLVYPLKSGKMTLSFHLIQKATTDDSVAYSFSGDRDNVKTLETKDTKIDLPPLELKVKALPEGTEIVGDFSVSYKVKTHKGKAFEPLPLAVSITGKGYPPIFENLLPQEGNFTRFTEAPEVKTIATLQGTQSTVTYPMALSHDKDFSLPALDIKAFNPKTKKAYTLLVPEQHFQIEKRQANVLLDKVDTPAPLHIDWSGVKSFLSYLLVFFVGVFSVLFYQHVKREKSIKNKETQGELKEKITQSKDLKGLLQILLSEDTKKFQIPIEQIEESLYGTTKTSLKNIKHALLETLK